jgi:hypothetical protein
MSDLSLRELFEQLIRDPATRTEFLADQAGFFEARGFGELEDPLMAEAITNAVAGFPPDVAEHFSEFTVAASPLPADTESDDPGNLDLADAFDVLASAPAWPESEIDETPLEDAFEDPLPEAMDDFGSGAGEDLGVGLADPGLGIDDETQANTDLETDAGVELTSDLTADAADADPLADLAEAGTVDPSGLDPMDLDEIDDPGDLGEPTDGTDGVMDG